MNVTVAAWMLDPAACAGMELGAPRVAVPALIELHSCSSNAVLGETSLAIQDSPRRHNMGSSQKPVPTTPAPSVIPRQYRIAFDSIRIQRMNASERAKAVVCLANLLMQAASVARGERDDDER